MIKRRIDSARTHTHILKVWHHTVNILYSPLKVLNVKITLTEINITQVDKFKIQIKKKKRKPLYLLATCYIGGMMLETQHMTKSDEATEVLTDIQFQS